MAAFKFLLASQRAHPSAIDRCLKYAISKGDENMIQHLINQGANRTDSGVLETATDASLSVLRLVLDQRPAQQQPVLPGNREDALKKAISMGAQGLELVECLLQSDTVGLCLVPPPDHSMDSTALIASRDSTALTASMGLAIEQCCQDTNDNTKVVELFLNAGYSPDTIVRSEYVYDRGFPEELQTVFHTFSNTTAMLLAIEFRTANLVKLFLDRGADVNLPATCRILRTPLQGACEVGSLDIVKLLLDRGADLNGKPARCEGATALQLAAISGNCNIAAELLDRGADLHQPPIKAGGRWPLEGAAEHGRLEMIELLWRVSIIGFDRRICIFAMKVAERQGNIASRDLIRGLMENGLPNSDVELRDLDVGDLS